ncbi:MAG: hypothetical protein FWB86_00985 [Treponema sp.]|nr:hypothetical protein [Treponema sp.]MCL2250673.1 hypothetical protein [Treponema sp.]
MKHKQPAELSYFFYGGFVDIARVISGAFSECGDIIGRSKDGIAEKFEDIIDRFREHHLGAIFTNVPNFFMFTFYLTRLIFCSIVTPLICFFIAIFQITILFTFFLIASIFFIIIILADRIFCAINAISNHCPTCQEHFYMPVYICSCGNEHTRLRPGIYGVLWRKCNCGKKLPTTFFNGRQKLEAKCPSCTKDVKDGGLQASWCIPVIGGPSSGKTCYINMTMMSLEKDSFSKYGLKFLYEKNDIGGFDEYEEYSNRLSKGYLPDKTTDYRLRYYQFSLTPKGATKQLISLCDVAGELFDITQGGDIGGQQGFKYANAFILIVDPLSIPDYCKEVASVAKVNEYKGSTQRLDEMVETFVRTLQNIFSIKASAMLNTDVAVVITKADIPGLDIKIGKNAIIKNSPSQDQKDIYKTQNELCEKFFREYNEDGFINNLKSRFRSIQFFTCSALGHVANGQPFVSSNVEEPFFWLVKKKSRVISKVIK